MSHEPDAHSFAYVECDIPPGMTIAEWRAQRAAERPAVTKQRPIDVARRRLRQAARLGPARGDAGPRRGRGSHAFACPAAGIGRRAPRRPQAQEKQHDRQSHQRPMATCTCCTWSPAWS